MIAAIIAFIIIMAATSTANSVQLDRAWQAWVRPVPTGGITWRKDRLEGEECSGRWDCLLGQCLGILGAVYWERKREKSLLYLNVDLFPGRLEARWRVSSSPCLCWRRWTFPYLTCIDLLLQRLIRFCVCQGFDSRCVTTPWKHCLQVNVGIP